jgi:hypothetical protein
MKNQIAFEGNLLRRDQGIALVMALVIILVGATCASLLFDITFRFFWVSQPQRNTYVNHTTVLDAIQTTKGYILSTNSADGVVMHPPDFNYSKTIKSLSDIRFPALELSKDMRVENGVGAQRLVVQVYDIFYNANNLDASLLSDQNQMRDLPPPISKMGDLSSGGDNIRPEGEKTISDTGGNDSIGGGGLMLDPGKYGSYLVRVLLYDVDKNDNSKLVRMAEEAFVQVLK